MKHGNDQRLRHLLESYGADPARWPPDEQVVGSDVLSTSVAGARDIDKILDMATVPNVPEGAVTRLMERIDGPQQANILLFSARPQRSGNLFRYTAALPLAASLALGIYLGAAGSLDFMLPASVTGGVATVDDTIDDLGGVGEADAFAEESLT